MLIGTRDVITITSIRLGSYGFRTRNYIALDAEDRRGNDEQVKQRPNVNETESSATA